MTQAVLEASDGISDPSSVATPTVCTNKNVLDPLLCSGVKEAAQQPSPALPIHTVGPTEEFALNCIGRTVPLAFWGNLSIQNNDTFSAGVSRVHTAVAVAAKEQRFGSDPLVFDPLFATGSACLSIEEAAELLKMDQGTHAEKHETVCSGCNAKAKGRWPQEQKKHVELCF